MTICKGVPGIEKESVQFKIKSGKTNKTGKPETIVVYATGDSTCPVIAIKKMQEMNRRLSADLPFFSANGAQPVTQNRFNSILKDLTDNTFKKGKLSGHSFRAGIPSMLGKMGYSDEQLKCIGGWSSRAFLAYTKLGRTRRAQMAKICSDLNKLN